MQYETRATNQEIFYLDISTFYELAFNSYALIVH